MDVKNSKGITLISLVITIIILIILAGVSIAIVFDEDGIINKAKKAAENMEIAAIEEQEMLNSLYEKFEGDVIIGDTVSTNKFNQLKTEYENYKTQIAQALTSKGVETSNEDSVEQIITNIDTLSTNKYDEGYASGNSAATPTVERIEISGNWNWDTGNSKSYTAEKAGTAYCVWQHGQEDRESPSVNIYQNGTHIQTKYNGTFTFEAGDTIMIKQVNSQKSGGTRSYKQVVIFVM